MEDKHAHKWIVAILVLANIFLVGVHKMRAQSSDKSNYGNNAFGYSVGSNLAFYNPKTERQTMNWNGSFWRCLGSKQERGGSFYTGLDVNSKLRFKYSDSAGVHVITTPTADFGFGFAIQNNLSAQYSGRVIKFSAGFPLENMSTYKFHFGADLQFNFNVMDFQSPLLGEWNLATLYFEVGVHGLVYQTPKVNQVLWSPVFGVGLAIQVPEKN